MGERGFILQPTYRIEAGRPVVHLYGRLESGDSFLLRDDRRRPHFYIRAGDLERALELGALDVHDSDRRTLDGHRALRLEVAVPSDAPPLRDHLIAHHVPTYEADVRFAMAYLIDRGVQGSAAIEGPWEPGEGVDRAYHNPVLEPADWTPELRVLSIDIETDPRASRLLSIALCGCGTAEVLLLCPPGYDAAGGAEPYADEASLLRAFVRRVRELDPDVLTGWNVIDFDLAVLLRLARKRRLPLELGRGPERLRLRPARGPWGGREASLPGRVVLDGIQLMRGAFMRMERWGLDAVAREVLGEGKTMTGHDRAEAILEAFENDRERFVAYNLNDARLVLDILDRLHLVELAVERSKLTGLPIDRVSGSIAAFDFLYLSALHRRRVVAPSVARPQGSAPAGGANLGGYVFEPRPGLYRDVLVLDFKSLYPSVMRTFQIDPLGYLGSGDQAAEDDDDRDDPIVAPNGARFRRRRGILTELLDVLLPRREAAKAAGDRVASHAIKILMNSFYGVLGTPACRFYRPQLAGAITSFGREILRWSRRRIESYGHEVLYGDTDSLFVRARGAGQDDDEALERDAALAIGRRLVERLNRDLAAYVEKRWRVPSRLEIELEKRYLHLFLPAVRGGRSGARKRYAGLVDDGGEGRVELIGLEAVRRDWTELAKTVQRQLYERLFRQRPVEDYLKGVVRDLRAGALDARLVYVKALRKPLASYTATTPPHVAAARKLGKKPGRRIAYVMTTAGPEPVAARQHPLDYEHYVQKQLRPVAEPVLALLGLDFARVIGDDAQLRLF